MQRLRRRNQKVRARPGAQQVQGLRRQQHLRARAAAQRVQGLRRQRPLRARAELRDAQAEAARNALAVRNTLDLERRAAPFPFHRQELQRSAARGRQEAEAGFARERQELLAETERLRAELQDARGDVATVRALAASGDVAAARNARRFAEAEAARNALAAQAAAAQQRADHAFTEAETSRNALAAQATQVNTLLARVQQQNSRIADLENLDRESWAALQMGVESRKNAFFGDVLERGSESQPCSSKAASVRATRTARAWRGRWLWCSDISGRAADRPTGKLLLQFAVYFAV